MTKVCLHVIYITIFFVSVFLVDALVSLPLPLSHQIEILLAFKKEFPPPTCSHTVLKSWNKSPPQNTSSFDGVVFDNKTGVVTELHLGEACLKGIIKPTSNLFKFHHLRYLDLSYNNFDKSSFPAEFGRLANLEVLNVSYNRLVGQVPSSIHNLSGLTYLDLSHNKLSGGFPLVCNLTKLSFLDLSYNNFLGTIPSSLFNMPSLLKLDLRQNHLRDPLGNLNSSSSSNLESLYLGSNFFTGLILEPISKLIKLTYLDLSFLNIIYPINIVFLPLKSLKYLDLSGNSISRLNTSSDHALTKLIGLNLSNCNIVEFPNFLMTLQSLEYLDLSGNRLSRLNTSSDHGLTKLLSLNLSNCNIVEFPNFVMTLQSLEYLDLSGNRLSRFNTSSDHGLTKLTGMSLSDCNIVEFPKVLKNIPNLQHLDICNNNLTGKVPGWLWNLPLTDVFLSHNSLDGFEGSPQVSINSPLEVLDLSSNAFRGSFPILPPTIEFVVAGNNSFTGELPLSLCSPKKLSLLDLSHNNFSGPIPQCLGDSVDGVMDLRHNNLTGQLPDIFCRSGSLAILDVSYNQISGKLPRSLVNCTRLELLNVGSNRITDTFPFWLKSLPHLKIMLLRSNRFHGPISSPENPLSSLVLQIIDISLNKFNGSIPPNYFVNWSLPRVITTEQDLNRERYYVQQWQSGISTLQYYPSIDVIYYGVNMELVRISLRISSYIDLSGNRFGGQIPESIGLLKSLYSLNLSNNDFTGHIPPSLTNLTDLTSLDLSRNQLSGTIPPELGSLSFLSYINVSNNNLTGEIPQGVQFLRQHESSFQGNINLCGLPLQKNCSGKSGAPSPQRQQKKPLKQEHVLNSKAATIGYRPTLMMFVLCIGHVIASYGSNWFI